MSEDTGQRRSTYREVPVSYVAVGASQDEDLMKFPPDGSTPFEHEVQLGSGAERFISAASTLMTWGAQEAAGIKVTLLSAPPYEPYASVTFNDSGVPQGHQSNEALFAPDGTPYLEAGSEVTFTLEHRGGKERQMRVVSTITEERRAGFVIGTTESTELAGEEYFRVELRGDDTVWAIVRGFLYDKRSSSSKLASKNPVKAEIAAAKDQIVALTPAVQATVKTEQESVETTDGSIIVDDSTPAE